MPLWQYFAKTLISQGFQPAKNTTFSTFLFHLLPILETLPPSYITKKMQKPLYFLRFKALPFFSIKPIILEFCIYFFLPKAVHLHTGLGRNIILNMFSSTLETKFCDLPIIIACIFQAIYDSILALQCKEQGRWEDLFPSLPQVIPFLLLLKVFLITWIPCRDNLADNILLVSPYQTIGRSCYLGK